MSQIDEARPDHGNVWNPALVAVVLVAAGLGLMFWDNHQGGLDRIAAKTAISRSAN